ncbi:MAG: hypothetical protein COV00_02390 [Candidatus Tagabacteria bacterium CG10_big_fil_rev_8_21_14_0_10_40_13]|uniref:Capsule synthesis protein CapA domain-containing protein n=1 Tax=Candidatus Tagabacteria bacterium CG10_big_fil_rev_8_21_14_0_10_40_13 TaxID=1975022 RepID=A0A2M8L8R5_9BACT|nr:MAG: hypothetical protein COV00_02390 [Candidatus Tagabacteria bacterium CG10_big_fil_rev_8_21_14_0_10_40_13]
MIKRQYILWSLLVLFLGFSLPLAGFLFVENLLRVSRFADDGPFVYVSEGGAASIAVPIKHMPLSLLFVGDIMLGRGVEESVINNAGGDFSFLFEKADFIKKADVAFGNLEGPVADAGNDLGRIYSFRFKPGAFTALLSAGFDVFSVANNHAADWGKEAFEQNIFRLKNENILPVGGGANFEDAGRVKIIKKNGIKTGFLGFSDVGPEWFEAGENTAGILLASRNYFSLLIKKAAKECDVLVVSLHFGEEYEKSANSRQKMLARLAVDDGAKIVVGHHSHVAQEVEEYNGGIIAYSLGNFIFDQNFSEETMEGLALEVFWENGRIAGFEKHKIRINQFFQPELVK